MTITEPAAAGAAARCLTARIRDRDRWLTTDHPSRCGWCDYPTGVLDGLVRGFNERVELDERQAISTVGAVAFAKLDRAEQRSRIAVAQELVDGPPPAPGAAPAVIPPTPSVAPSPDVPPRPDWLGGPS